MVEHANNNLASGFGHPCNFCESRFQVHNVLENPERQDYIKTSITIGQTLDFTHRQARLAGCDPGGFTDHLMASVEAEKGEPPLGKMLKQDARAAAYIEKIATLHDCEEIVDLLQSLVQELGGWVTAAV